LNATPFGGHEKLLGTRDREEAGFGGIFMLHTNAVLAPLEVML